MCKSAALVGQNRCRATLRASYSARLPHQTGRRRVFPLNLAIRYEAFTLVEILVVLGLVVVLVALLVPVFSGTLRSADRAKATGLMRGVGKAIFAKTSENNGILPGPLWPGQVAEFDRNRQGRLVVELAPFLDLESRNSPYVVERFLTGSLRRTMRNTPTKDIRLYVMNMAVATPNGTINPWGSATGSPPGGPFPLSAIPTSELSRTPMLSEAHQGHPNVASAPWRASTPPKPPHGEKALQLFFDGSVR